MEILCFFAGTAFVYVNKLYPFLLVLSFFFFRRKASFWLWFCAAILFAYVHAWIVSDYGMPHQNVVKHALLSGKIVSIPSVASDKTQFQFAVQALNGKSAKAVILLNCYRNCPDFKAGQYWQLQTKIKRPHNLGNPGSFDYAGLLHARHIDWTGYIRAEKSVFDSEKSDKKSLLILRQYLANKVSSLTFDERTLGIVQALSLGVTTHIDKGEWELFRRTGTIHLMVISGAHIGLVAGLIYSITRWLWCCSGRWCLRIPAPKVASALALLSAFIYSILSGFAVPAERALIVCFFMLIRNFCGQRFTTWQAWRYALFVVILYEPHSVMSSGFYLSFIAVAVLVLANQRINSKGIKQTVMLQLACLIGLMPLTIFWFSYGAVNGLIANLVAIPWVGLVVVPLVLITVLLVPFVSVTWLVFITKHAILALLLYLNWVDAFSAVNVTYVFYSIFSPIILMGVLAIYVFIPLREYVVLTSLMAVLVLFPAYAKPKQGEASFYLLDVGQGLCVVVRTANHTLIYDTGAKFFHGGDMGKMALIPYLKTTNIRKLDAVVISHPDIDHRGGLDSLAQQYSIDSLIVDDPDWYHRGKSCYEIPEWTWDGVRFQFFATSMHLPKKNNHSCVLQVSTPGGQVLLTGDIEVLAEDYLIEHYGARLQSSVLLIPHHASKSSSSEDFLDTVRPQEAIASYGFDNAYHFPHAQAVNRYEQRHIPIYNTLDCGMVHLTLLKRLSVPPVRCYLR